MSIEYKFKPEFQHLLPPLNGKERGELEANILKNGVMENPRTWQGFVFDGHHRIAIATEHGVPFEITDDTARFATEDDVIEWMLSHQLGRRSVTEGEATVLLGELYQVRKRLTPHEFTEEERLKGGSVTDAEPVSDAEREEILDAIGEPDAAPEAEKPKRTSEQLAEEAGVSERTVRRAGKTVEALDELGPEVKQDFVEGKITQKEVLEKAAEKKEPAKPKVSTFAPGKNENTLLVEGQVKRLSIATQNYERKVKEILATRTETVKKMPALAVELAQKFADQIKANLVRLDELGDLYICEKCNGAGCDENGCNLGLVDVDTRHYQLRKIKEDDSWKPGPANGTVTEEVKPEKAKKEKKASKKSESKDTDPLLNLPPESEQSDEELPDPEAEAEEAPRSDTTTEAAEPSTATAPSAEAPEDTEASPEMNDALERHPSPPDDDGNDADEEPASIEDTAEGLKDVFAEPEAEPTVEEVDNAGMAEPRQETSAEEDEAAEAAASADSDDLLDFIDDVIAGKSSSD